MPKQLASFDFKFTARRDWAPLLDGSIWVLTKGEDFDGDTRKFSYKVRAAARRYGKSLKVSVDAKAGTVTFQAGEKLAAKPEAVKPAGVLKKPGKKAS